ncbi:MAG: FecR domain-containing protein [Prolixibacteraceae bacterium]
MEEHKNTEEAWIAWLAGETDIKPKAGEKEIQEFDDMEHTWNLAGTSYVWKNSNPDKAWTEINKEIEVSPGILKTKRFNFLKYAAVFTALFALGTVTFLLTRSHTITQEQMAISAPAMKIIQTVANPAEITSVVLPDGSSVRMNAGSTLKYPEKFTGSERKVEFLGEAYFEVIHDAAHPFVVEMKNIRVEDIGTSFNILAYPGKDRIEVNVTDGSVRLVDSNRKESAILVAGSNGKIHKEDGNIQVSNELSPNFMAWITRELTFHHTPLSTVFEELENIYHVKIEIADPKIAGISYTANFEKFQIEDIVNVIAKTHHLSVMKQADGFLFASK